MTKKAAAKKGTSKKASAAKPTSAAGKKKAAVKSSGGKQDKAAQTKKKPQFPAMNPKAKEDSSKSSGNAANAERTGEVQPPGKWKGGKFVKGVSGNPAGRPKGAKDRLSLSVLQKLQASGNDVAQKVLELAIQKGDVQAARIVIERLVAKADSQPIRWDFITGLESAADIDQELTHLLQGVAAGKITPGQSKYLRELLEAKAEAIQRAHMGDVRSAFALDEAALAQIRSQPELFAAASRFTALLGQFFIDRQHPVIDVAGVIAGGEETTP